MNKRIFVYSIAISAVIALTLGLMQSSSIAYGQTAETTDTATATASTTGGQNTFSAKGSINTLIIKDGALPQQPNEQTSYVLDGKWKLEVINGNVTDYNGSFRWN